jgi:hypothetical protein
MIIVARVGVGFCIGCGLLVSLLVFLEDIPAGEPLAAYVADKGW